MDENTRERVPPSCANCRRKKSKCDRRKPCSACVKSKLSCSYEKVTRTPLTRKHLTSVELELAKAKALLTDHGHRRPTSQGNEQSVLSSPLPQNGTYQMQTESTPVAVSRVQISCQAQSSGPTTNVSPSFSLESPPAGDLDWDERSSNLNKTHFNDGMASLVDRNGYMGVASGAALLRMADEGGAELDLQAQPDALPSSRGTPQVIPPLYSLAQLEPFIDAYFSTYHVSYPIVHEPTFRAQFMEVVPRPHGQSWQVLLYIVAAIGCFAASEVAPDADQGLFEAAKQRMNIDMLETGNITLVQALTLISNYIQKRNRPNSGYNYMGLAKRMAWGLALHKEFPAWRNQPFRLELRRRVWWCLYIFDVGGIITFSRPLDMPADGIEVSLPLNLNDGDMTASTVRVRAESQLTTLYTHVRCQAQFHLATNHIYQRLISSIPSAQEMLRLDEADLQSWLAEVPSFFHPGVPQQPKYRLCHAILQWRWRNFRLLMFRPYLMRRFMKHRADANQSDASDAPGEHDETAIRLCLETAQESIHMISNFWNSSQQNVLTCWYALYFLFQAVLIPVICLRNDTYSDLAPGWRDEILVALEAITDMNRLNPAASRCHSAITKLCGPYLALDITEWHSPTNESPQTQMNSLYSYMFGPVADSQLFNVQDLQMQDPTFFDFMGQLGAP
ncbi:hypothetical protein H2198_003717 [Neophaeococcomyces mojaviensis]|uniref:Uncharacterized protein n=1 Tax=Neophaeococcomyces mojaviensis TaxID=3383035 RepID=A0ACC3AAN0_9EURO|nr:hypothetical protein H2198_003717 [Knufia sp. JES_112]